MAISISYLTHFIALKLPNFKKKKKKKKKKKDTDVVTNCLQLGEKIAEPQ
jgi:hypothetical protein